MATTYTTENGVGKWENDTISGSGLSQGMYYGFGFTLNSDSLNAEKPNGTGGSLTSATGGDASFATGDKVALTKISVAGYNSSISACFGNVAGIEITGSDGTSFKSDSMETAAGKASDPWDPSHLYSSATATFTFPEDIFLTIGTQYTAAFFNTAGEKIFAYLRISTNGDLGYDVRDANGNIQSSGYSAAGLTVVTEGTPAVPEPATTTLSLLALAGLMARRRR